MKLTIKIGFTEFQIALASRAHPPAISTRLTELSFAFDQTENIVDCIGTIKDSWTLDQDYAGKGLVYFYDMARRRLTARPTSSTLSSLYPMHQKHRISAAATSSAATQARSRSLVGASLRAGAGQSACSASAQNPLQ
jgi:hypothetical protein